MTQPAIRIDIVSDVVCPWCIIGYRQLQRALQDYPESLAADLRWHPFELNPNMPAGGQDLAEHMAQKYGSSREQSRAARQRLTELGASLDFEFNYDDNSRIYNTFSAHQLLHWAGRDEQAPGSQTQLKLALFDACFTRQENVEEPEILLAAVERAGLDATQASAVLNDGRYQQAVRDEQAVWLDRGVHAVPTFVFDDKYMIPGAQDSEVFLKVFGKLREQATAEAES